jgi:hypothetical protein
MKWAGEQEIFHENTTYTRLSAGRAGAGYNDIRPAVATLEVTIKADCLDNATHCSVGLLYPADPTVLSDLVSIRPVPHDQTLRITLKDPWETVTIPLQSRPPVIRPTADREYPLSTRS